MHDLYIVLKLDLPFIDSNSVVWNEVEAVDVGGDLFGSGEDCARFLDLDAEAVVMKMALEPVVTVITFGQETKVADFHDPVS